MSEGHASRDVVRTYYHDVLTLKRNQEMDTLLVYVYVFPPHSARVIEATDTCRPHSVQRSILQPALNGTSAIVPGISAQLDSFSFSGAIVHNSLPTSSHDLYRNFSARSPSAPAMPVGNRPLVLDPYMESMALAVPRVQFLSRSPSAA